MDFFNDPNLFAGVLDGLEDESFPPAPSLVDELNLSADFEPLRMDPLGPGKPDTLPPVPTQQAIPAYSEQMGHYIGAKAQTTIGQPFVATAGANGGGGGAGMIGNQHSQYHNAAAMGPVPQSNGLFCNSSSPMWGNQEQNGSVYHHLPQQQLHNHQLHARQPTQQQQQQHHPCHQQQEQHHRMRQQLHHHHQQQLLNQHQHQQINNQTIAMQQQQQHHGYPFHQGGTPAQSQQQVYHPLPPRPSPGFHSRPLPNKPYMDLQSTSLSSRPCFQTQQQQQQQRRSNYPMPAGGAAFSGSGPEPSDLLYAMHSSPMVHHGQSVLGQCSVSQYPAYPGEPETPSLAEQPLAPPASSSSLERLCPFRPTEAMSQQHARTLMGQASEYAVQGLRCTDGAQGDCKSSDMFGKSMSFYPAVSGQLPSEQPRRSCGAANTNGYPALGDQLLPSGVQHGDLEELEPSDLLPDLLPQLEATLSQQDQSSSGSWADSSHSRGHEPRRVSLVDYKDAKVNQLLSS